MSEPTINKYAIGLADDIPAWPREAASDLAQLLINFSGLPSPARAREARLGLLVELIIKRKGKTITPKVYSRTRAKEAEAGRDWPAVSKLADEYGSWIRARELAQSVARGERRGVSSSTHHYGFRKQLPHTRADLLGALVRCYRELGYWPRHSDYLRWSKWVREEERVAGKTGQWIPSASPIIRYFGTWERAIQLAQKQEAGR